MLNFIKLSPKSKEGRKKGRNEGRKRKAGRKEKGRKKSRKEGITYDIRDSNNNNLK